MFSLFRKPIFIFLDCQESLTVVFRSSHTIYYIQDYFLYYILVCLSKVFQRTVFSFVLPFQRESVCKGKTFFRNLQIFSIVFFEKIFGRFSEGVRLTLSRSLAHRKVRYSVQQSALSPVASALPVCHLQRLSLSKAVAKVQTFSVSATFTPYFFAEIFQVLA